MAKTLADRIIGCLKSQPEHKFIAREISQWIMKDDPNWCEEKKRKSEVNNTDAKLEAQIVAEIGERRPKIQERYPNFRTIEVRPRQYYWTEKTDKDEIIEIESNGGQASEISDGGTLMERDLYPLLSEFLYRGDPRVYPKRIDEKKSSKKRGPQGNKWLHPDMVGVENLTDGWHEEIKKTVNEAKDRKGRLWSFEAKIRLNRSNIRESFFQAVSNSSWANYGYLVVIEIVGGETLKELRILSDLHGIGLIRIDPENPTESETLLPARERMSVDWATCDRLASENKDFLEFIKLVTQFNQTGVLHKSNWDINVKEELE